ncbi:MAG: cysteine desulfurase family protein [Bacilli bacterium]|jgi:cysteine desulfurase
MLYFDYAATTPVYPEVLKAYHELLEKYYANSASAHYMGSQVASLQNRARQQIADLFGVKSNEIIFTGGASEANNLAIKGVAFQAAKRGKHLITTSVEHPSVLNTFKQLEEEFGYEVTYLPIDETGRVQLSELKKALKKTTTLVSIMFVNNETGVVNPVEEIAAYLKVNWPLVCFHVDATQGIAKIKLDVHNIDLLSLSAHKIYGLKGSGLLLKKEKVQLLPLISGGEQEFGLRAGTSNWPVNVMLAKTLRLGFENRERNYQKVLNFNKKVRAAIASLEGLKINSPSDAMPYILNVSFMEKKAGVIANYFEKEGICVSSISACSSQKEIYSPTIAQMFKDEKRALSSIRICFSHFNSDSEIEKLITVIKKALSATK